MLSSSGGPLRLYFLVTLSQSYFVHTQPLMFRRWWNHWMAQVSEHAPYHYGRYDFIHTREYICSWITVVSLIPFDLMNMHKQHALGINHSLKLEFWSFPGILTYDSTLPWCLAAATTAALGQSLKYMNKQPIYHRSFHCWAVAFCGPGILAECLT